MSQSKNQSNPKDSDFSGPDGEALERIMDAFLDHLVAARKSLGLQQQELATRSGLAPGHMSNIETGRRRITLPTFVRIAKGLEMRPAELAAYLGSLPNGAHATNRATVVAVATDGTAKRDSLHDALGELGAIPAGGAKKRGQLHSPRTKVSSAKKDR